ncbi:acyloxyacyl hydrolase [Neptunicella marina]|uniref:Lipid A deacylase n=1 Tax=Neptunicella marina TaxID=2125989 RepID=A0A8J6M0S3_9ALTE|nr:acyloxyacyl hydrolase [Neptunicella marina]MBC3767660.1 acyloxyacyl hydrolase [Neptunicella marina]
MNKLAVIWVALLLHFLPAHAANLNQGIAIDYLDGESRLSGLRLAYRPYYGTFSQIKQLGELDVYWEMSVNLWEFGENNHHDTNLAIAISPVFSSQFTTVANKYPLKWEFGIGVSLIDDTQFAGKDIGSHYQFEDRLGLVMLLDEQQSVSMRYMHYSNGGLNSKNPGLDFFNLSYGYRF